MVANFDIFFILWEARKLRIGTTLQGIFRLQGDEEALTSKLYAKINCYFLWI
jgi:hypothetical protein